MYKTLFSSSFAVDRFSRVQLDNVYSINQHSLLQAHAHRTEDREGKHTIHNYIYVTTRTGMTKENKERERENIRYITQHARIVAEVIISG